MRRIEGLAQGWLLRRGDDSAWLSPDFEPEGWESVTLPRSNIELPLNGFDEKSYQFISTWLRDLEISAGDLGAGRRQLLDFEAVMTAARVFVNGREAGGHEGGYTPFSLELTGLLREGRNRLAVVVDSRELPGVPPFGHVVDYLSFGGIYREVFLRVVEAASIASVFARPEGALKARKRLRLEVEFAASTSPAAASLRLVAELRPAKVRPSSPALATASLELAPGSGAAELLFEDLEGIDLWEPAHPALYSVLLRLEGAGGEIDAVSVRFGWREAEWRPEGFFLNGRLLKLRGLNRHQAWPYVGYAMPERVQRRDAEILKRELGLDMVRSSHYPPSRHFLDACDELGLLVFEELPGWHHIGDEAWKRRALEALEAMILRDRNRPSVVLWGVRVNESADDHDFYTRTNALARRLDPTRATGGVRWHEKSELLEDVFTFNDFTHAGGKAVLKAPRRVTGLRRDVPYLVTEHDGHMFPVKRFDQEERLAEQALRHARVLDAALGSPSIAGALGWCAFDYNTHKDFGSGDRVCYHGVSDLFRIPKYAAFVYASQVEPSERIVLEAASLFAKGERDAAALLPVQVWTNCDEVLLYRAGERIGSYRPDRASFPHLPHPPVVIADLIGDRLAGEGFSARDQRLAKEIVGVVLSKGLQALSWLQLLRMGHLLFRKRMSFADGERLVMRFAMGWGQADETWELAGRVGGKEVARRRYGGDARAERLSMEADDEALFSDGVDATRVTLRLLDQYGNLHPFAAEAVELSIEGPGELLGPSLLPLLGGASAFWVRSSPEAGTIRVAARGSRFAAETRIASGPRP